jgi:PadR family transcriptional regulator PadR
MWWMRSRELKLVILKLFGNREFYGYQIHKVLVSEEIKVEISRLYRLLNEMMREGLLESRWEKSRMGPRKRVYKLGEKGKKELNNLLLDAIRTVHGFYGAYLMSLLPKINVFEDLISSFTEGVKGNEKIAYVISKYSRMNDVLLGTIQHKFPQIKLFLVKPASVTIDLTLDNMAILDGSYTYIPLKEEHIDRLVIIDLPKKEHLKAALKEWHRVLTQDGKLAICTPTILLSKYEDPLTIGDFIEKYEHETIEKGEHLDSEFLQTQLNKFFDKIEEKEIVHMSIYQISDPHNLQN